jgi:hypothetical protein
MMCLDGRNGHQGFSCRPPALLLQQLLCNCAAGSPSHCLPNTVVALPFESLPSNFSSYLPACSHAWHGATFLSSIQCRCCLRSALSRFEHSPASIPSPTTPSATGLQLQHVWQLKISYFELLLLSDLLRLVLQFSFKRRPVSGASLWQQRDSFGVFGASCSFKTSQLPDSSRIRKTQFCVV